MSYKSEVLTYPEAIQYMFDRLPMFHRIGVKAYKKDLSRTLAMCERLGNPQTKLQCIHIAGTNGKGSVSHMLAAALQQHGYSVGLYTSPHYRDFRERIKINGTYIEKRFVSRFISEFKSIIEEIEPSFFELTVALCFYYFQKKQVDYAVIETGLGGRLDSTNIISPLLSVITNVSWDHMDVLGNSLPEIAFEKAGIIKPGIPVIIGRHLPVTDEVFNRVADERKADMVYAERISMDLNDDKIQFTEGEVIFTPDLSGPFQPENYRTAFASLHYLLSKKIIPLDYMAISKAFGQVASLTRMIGRWQWAGRRPDILLDSAHNEDGIRQLCQWIASHSYHTVHWVIGFVKDKDLSKVMVQLPSDAKYYFTQAKIPRALEVNELHKHAESYNLKGKCYKSVRNAYKSACVAAAKDDLVVVSGSIFVLSEII